ncbi:MFS transporter [Sphingomonas alpina]|uniref:MFS transporter n=1 Tax=Sphingomonas alpina TaxID=653931 RepID=UPI0021BB308F|nr:MFS transporter [Sphingomonas alpina]
MTDAGTGAAPASRLESSVLVAGAAMVVATEFTLVGISPYIAAEMELTLRQAAGFMTSFALGSAIVGPFAASLTRHLRADHALILSLTPFVLSAVLPLLGDPIGFGMLRFVQGAALPLFIGVATNALARLHGDDAVATSRIYLGVAIGALLAAPLGVAVAAWFGWTRFFLMLGLVAAAIAVAVALLPRLRLTSSAGERVGARRILFRRSVQAQAALTLIQFAAMFCLYAFIAPILTASHVGPAAASGWLLLFGLAGIAGTMIAGYATGRALGTAAIAIAALLVLPGLLLQFLPLSPFALLLSLSLWGMAHSAAFVVCQLRMTRAAPQAPRLAAALNISAANLGIALGTSIGGWSVALGGMAALGGTAALLGLIALAGAWRVARDLPSSVHPAAV